MLFTILLSSARSALTGQQRPDLSFPFKIIVAIGGEKVCGTVPFRTALVDFSVRELGVSFDPLDHAVY
jgi:hypothetical protein